MKRKKKSHLSVIAGIYKRRKIFTPQGEEVRPLTGICKKSMFDILKPVIKGAKFLDLFSGTGSVGIEALSRGALSCVFVESNSAVIKTLKENLERIGIGEEKFKIFYEDVFSFIERTDEKFDVIFIGPPFKLELPEDFIDKILRIAADGSIIIVQRYSRAKFRMAKQPYRSKTFGATTLDYYKK